MNIYRIIKRFIRADDIKVMGRWEINTCRKMINRKIDYSNEDHCGTCGYTNKNKINNVIKNENKKILTEINFLN